MNKVRRAELKSWAGRMDALKTELEVIREDEQCSYDNLPEGLQCSDRGYEMEDYIAELDDALLSLQSALETVYGIINKK